MSETFTEENRNGWTITVWQNGLGNWNYVATKRELYRAGWVIAVHRTEAITNALMEIGDWQ